MELFLLREPHKRRTRQSGKQAETRVMYMLLPVTPQGKMKYNCPKFRNPRTVQMMYRYRKKFSMVSTDEGHYTFTHTAIAVRGPHLCMMFMFDMPSFGSIFSLFLEQFHLFQTYQTRRNKTCARALHSDVGYTLQLQSAPVRTERRTPSPVGNFAPLFGLHSRAPVFFGSTEIG